MQYLVTTAQQQGTRTNHYGTSCQNQGGVNSITPASSAKDHSGNAPSVSGQSTTTTETRKVN
jgi:hypothetical protein